MSDAATASGKALRSDAGRIATLMMEAMNHDCCRWFAGPGHTLEEFHALLVSLIERPDTQYSMQNAITRRSPEGDIIGVAVSYPGSELRRLRQPFLDGLRERFGRDITIADETEAGELYLDTLAVEEDYRGQGIATDLLRATIEKGREMGLPTGLLVDEGNPRAERLYERVGFRHVGDNSWGGHAMRHLLYNI